MEPLVNIVFKLLAGILILLVFLSILVSLCILYQRHVKFGHIPGPPVHSFLKGNVDNVFLKNISQIPLILLMLQLKSSNMLQIFLNFRR